jgi:hypothetical protein
MSRSSVVLDNLRAVIIVVVVGFHAVLAYVGWVTPSGLPFDSPPYQWRAFPIIDSARWFGFDLFCALQDVYLMSLLFFVSGLFVWPSLRRKGAWTFLTDRLMRLGIPFVWAVAVLMPLTLYPVYRVTAADPSLAAFWQHWNALPFWPSGPQWFIWQLLVLNVAAAFLFRYAPGAGEVLRRWSAVPPERFALGLVAASALAYVPLALAFTPWEWSQYEPFGIQLSRPLHYAVYFFAGVGVGAHGLDRGLTAPDGTLVRHWPRWLAAGAAAFLLWMGFTALTMEGDAPLVLDVAGDVAFVLACAGSGLASIALFLRFATTRRPVLDSLKDNAYGIYIVHYLFVVWLQYALLDAPVHAIVKAALVFIGALAMSWAASAGLRAMPLGARLVGAEPRAVAKAS